MADSRGSSWYHTALRLGEDNIWRAPTVVPVSYPAEGSQNCFALEDESFWFAHRNRVIINALRYQSPPPSRLLDIGGGNGYVARALQDAGYLVTLLEPSETGTRNARARNIADVICAAFDPSLFVPGGFQIAGLFDVIEHVEDDVGMLRQIRCILPPDGVVAITVPAFQTLFSPDDTHAGHFRRYTVRTMRALLQTAGFDPITVSYFMAPLVLPVLLLRALPARLGFQSRSTQQRRERDHGKGSRLAPIAAGLLAAEATFLARGGKLPFGTSCMAVARVSAR